MNEWCEDIAKQLDLSETHTSNEEYAVTIAGTENSEWKFVNGNTYLARVQTPSVHLKQTPQEVIQITFNITGSISVTAINRKNYNYRTSLINITFSNLAHLFSQNYVYELQMNHVVKELNIDRCLYTFKRTRPGSSITIEELYFTTYTTKLNLENLILCVRRIPHKEPVQRKFTNLMSSKFSKYDVEFKAENQCIPAHKSVLSRHSVVFEKMFSNEMQENITSTIAIDRKDAEVMKLFIAFLYTGKVQNHDFRYDLLRIAHLYEVKSLVDICTEDIIFYSSFDNAMDTLHVAALYDIPVLKEGAKKLEFEYGHSLMEVESNYQEYLTDTMSIENAFARIIFAKKHNLDTVKSKALDILSKNYEELRNHSQMSDLFDLHPDLIREVLKRRIT